MTLSRLAIDASRALATPRTGTEWYSHEIIHALARLHRRPALSLYARRNQDTTDLPTDAFIRRIGPPRLWTHVGLSWALARSSAEALFVPSHVVPIVHPRTTVVTVHDLGYRIEPDSHPRRTRTMLDLTTRWSVRVARRVVAVSTQTERDLAVHYRVPAEKMVVIHSGVNPRRFYPLPPADIQRRLDDAGVPRPYVLFLSTVQPRKNVVRLVEAFESIDRLELQLVIAGRSGWLSEDIEQRIQESSHRDRIHRLGYVDDQLVHALYCGAEVFALPSLYEGFGMGILEAMACGAPVVTSDGSSLPEVAGEAAILVDPRDVRAIREGIERALQPDTRRHLIQRGFRRATDFTWDLSAQQTMRTIQNTYDAQR